MKINVKKVFRVIAFILLLFCLGFVCGYLFDRSGNAGDTRRTAADVGGYDAAAKRIESAAGFVADAAGNVREASGEIRIIIDDVGNVREIACGIADGTVRALDGSWEIEDGIRRVVGILDDAEKRNKKMEEFGDSELD